MPRAMHMLRASSTYFSIHYLFQGCFRCDNVNTIVEFHKSADPTDSPLIQCSQLQLLNFIELILGYITISQHNSLAFERATQGSCIVYRSQCSTVVQHSVAIYQWERAFFWLQKPIQDPRTYEIKIGKTDNHSRDKTTTITRGMTLRTLSSH